MGVTTPLSRSTDPLAAGFARLDRSVSETFGARGHQRSVQRLTLLLEGITAGDYVNWVCDPEPPALGRELMSVRTQAESLGDRIDLELCWDREPPTPREAAVLAGFPLIPEVVDLRSASPTVD